MAESRVERAARAIVEAEALLVTAGAGMGVDSGLPDFRGDEGFWRAYPPFAKLGLSFADLANPRWFSTDPHLAWGFYGHRLSLYRATRPHAGFEVLRRWAQRTARGAWVFTSNVDGAFQRAGFDPARVAECHGAIDYVQCTRRCGLGIVRADPWSVAVDEATFRAADPLPTCPRCGALLRPNILMFGDGAWDAGRSDAAEEAFARWLADLRADGARLVIVECGAGTAIPTVRKLGEGLATRAGATLVRINVREADVPSGQIGISGGARAVLEAIDACVSR